MFEILSYVYIDTVTLFVDIDKVSPAIKEYLDNNNILIKPYDNIQTNLIELANKTSDKIYMDCRTLNYAIYR